MSSIDLIPFYIDMMDGVYIVRDDIIKGGTKRRAIDVFMNDGEEIVYASPAQGYAQVALAYGGQDHNKKVTIFVAQRKELHPLTKEAEQAGAKIIQVPMGYLSNVTAKAKKYCEETGATLLPFGLHDERFINRLAEVMGKINLYPTELWCVASSGTLASAMRKRWKGIPLKVVRVGHAPDLSDVEIYTAPEKYEQPAKIKPSFPSCINYDAKAWRFVKQYAGVGALFWNVGE